MFPMTSRTGPFRDFPMELVSWKLLKLRMKHFLSQPNFVFIVKCCMRLSLLAEPSLVVEISFVLEIIYFSRPQSSLEAESVFIV